MISSMRSFATTPIFKAILVLLVSGLIALAFGNQLYNSNPEADIAVRFKEMRVQRAALRNQVFQIAQSFQAQRPFESRQAFLDADLGQQAVQSLVERAALLDYAQANGQVASVADVTEVQKRRPEFRLDGGQGEFSIELYENFMSLPNVDRAAFIESSKQQAVLTLYRELIDAVVNYPSKGLDNLEKDIVQQRQFSLVKLDSSEIDAYVPTLPELRDYFSANKADYFWPEMRDLSYIAFTAADLSARYELSDEQIAAEFERRKDSLRQPEFRNLQQVNFGDDQDKAAAFSALAQEQGWQAALDSLEEGQEPFDLGPLSKDSAAPEMIEAAFSLEAEGVTKAFESAFGWLVVNVSAITAGYEPSLETEAENITNALRIAQAQSKIFDLSQELDYAIGDGKTLEEASAQFDLPFYVEKQVSAAGVTKEGQDSAIRFKPLVLKDAFAEAPELGKAGLVLDDKNGTYYVIRVDSITPKEPKSFNDARDQVTRDLKREHIRKAKDELVAQAIAQMNDEQKTLQELAQDNGTEIVQTPSLNRFDFVNEGQFYSRQAELFFTAQKGQPFSFDNLGERYIVMLDGVNYDEGEDQMKEFAKIQREQFIETYRQDVSTSLTQAIFEGYDYKVNQKIVSEVVADVADQLSLK